MAISNFPEEMKKNWSAVSFKRGFSVSYMWKSYDGMGNKCQLHFLFNHFIYECLQTQSGES